MNEIRSDKKYGLMYNGTFSAYGFRTLDDALRYASKCLLMWVADHGGGLSLEVCAYQTVAKIGLDTALPARAEEKMSLAALIDELVAGRVETAGNGEFVGTAGRWAGDVCRIMCLALDIISTCCHNSKVGKDAPLEADGADKAGNGAESAPQGVGGVAADRDEAVGGAKVEASAKIVHLLRLLDFLALEFVRLALEFYEPCVEGGDIAFKCRDLAAAKERAEALKRLAARVDELEECNDIGNAHALIIAFAEYYGKGNNR